MRTCGAPFMTRKARPVLLSDTIAIVYLSTGLKGTNFFSVYSCTQDDWW